MPANNVEQIKIWKTAHAWLKHLSDEYKANGNSSASMTSLASQAILAIQEPLANGNGHKPAPCGEEEGKQ